MKKTKAIPVSIFGLVLALAGNALAQYAQNLFISPTRVTAGRTFNLSALSYDFSCASTFTNLSVAVDGNNINLSFLPGISPVIDCQAQDNIPYGPTFSVSALAAGSYKIGVIEQLNCQVCAALPVLHQAGTLVVQDSSTPSSWFIQPKQALPNTYFTLRLLNDYYGMATQCGTLFTHASHAMIGDSLLLTFAVEPPTGTVVCGRQALLPGPMGPVFDSLKLAAGKYPVYAVEQPVCALVPPYCPTVGPTVAPMPVFVDTLEILSTTSVEPKRETVTTGNLRMPGVTDAIRGYRVNGRKAPLPTPWKE